MVDLRDIFKEIEVYHLKTDPGTNAAYAEFEEIYGNQVEAAREAREKQERAAYKRLAKNGVW